MTDEVQIASNEGRVIHIDLTPYGFEGQWVDLRNPKYLTSTRFSEIVADMQAQPEPIPESLIGAERAEAGAAALRAAAARTERGLRSIFAAWHLVNEDTGADMNDPATDDLAGLTFGHTKIVTDAWWDRVRASFPKALRSR